MPLPLVPRPAGFRASKAPAAAPDPVPAPRARGVLFVSLALGLLLFVWQLGSTGLVDETPPLFAASARAMAESGDWLIPRVNGLPRYDKPPLVYWAMGLIYALPGQSQWDPLGTWAARLPSALATVAAQQGLALTLLRWPQARRQPSLTALGAGLAFALSPLVLLWGRIAVSDALLTATLALSLLLIWQSYASAGRRWWAGWLVLGLAVLTKGPVAVVLLGLTLVLFAALQTDWRGLWRSLRPLRGLLLTALVALPWYGAALVVEGDSFWRSFFGYHNLQRFTSVVNNHQAPWWFFGLVLVVASLPLTPLLLLGLVRAVRGPALAPPLSLQGFAACWLLAVLLFFSAAATKLPSYWLPATPAAGLLIALAAQRRPRLAWRLCALLALLLALVFAAAPLWVPWIVSPEIPQLPETLLASALVGWRRGSAVALLALQLPLVLFVPLALLPLWQLGDQLRGEPVRRLAAAAVERQAAQRQAANGAPEPLAMVGMLKPSLHFYGRQVVIYEGAEAAGLVNLAERLASEVRRGQVPSRGSQQPHLLLVIDADTAAREHWRGLDPELLDQAGIYRLWRLDRHRLEQRAGELAASGVRADWRDPRPERY
jgi:4-amino-4-deoxy-L-arabinose transferase-like glycosyltransferase